MDWASYTVRLKISCSRLPERRSWLQKAGVTLSVFTLHTEWLIRSTYILRTILSQRTESERVSMYRYQADWYTWHIILICLKTSYGYHIFDNFWPKWTERVSRYRYAWHVWKTSMDTMIFDNSWPKWMKEFRYIGIPDMFEKLLWVPYLWKFVCFQVNCHKCILQLQ